ncbi:MAG: hypothetical protein K5765_06865 [Clostridia bacterium]|nr:hypothetical protein [Clostridia bacterium]
MEEEKVVLNIANKKTIRCLRCKKGMHNFLALYCLAYDKKPDDVYYESADCSEFEPINDEKEEE